MYTPGRAFSSSIDDHALLQKRGSFVKSIVTQHTWTVKHLLEPWRFFYAGFFITVVRTYREEVLVEKPHSSGMELPRGTTLRSATYRLEHVLGRGGFGITYYGQELALHRPVAVKEHAPYGCQRRGLEVVPGQLSPEDYQASLERFAKESRTLAQFDHPAIVRVLTVFEEAGTAYLVMEYVEGLSLEQIVEAEGKLDSQRACDYLKQACLALQVVHARGLLHRDIKPSNLLIRRDGRLVLVDFGSARESDLRRATAMVSAGYSPPELYREGAKTGPATDIYALGATFFHILAGEPPPDCLQRLMGSPLPLEKLAGFPFAAALERALELDAGQRHQSMGEFLAALEPCCPPTHATQLLSAPPLLAEPAASPTVDTTPPATLPPRPDPEGGELSYLPLVGHRAWVRALACSPDGRFLASGSEDKSIRIWSQGIQAAVLSEHTGWIWALVFSEDGSRLYSAGYDRQLLVWDTATWKRIHVQRICDAVQCMSLWGVWLALGTLGGRIEIRRLPDLGLERTIKLPGGVTSCAFTQGELAAAAGDDKIYLLDIDRGEVAERLKGHQGTVRALVTLPNGALVSGGADRKVRMWDLDHGQSRTWTGHTGTILALATDGGERVVSASADKTVHLWDVNGQSRELGRHQGEVSTVVVDGQRVASAGQDNLIRLWPL